MPLSSDDSPDPQRKTAAHFDNSFRYSVDISLIGDDEMAALNRDYRKKNKPTDVLSFSLWEGDDSFVASLGENQEIALGDIVISLDTAMRQASELGHSVQRELEFLAVHGTLHLLGYDHIRAADRRMMWLWQEKIVEQLTIAN